VWYFSYIQILINSDPDVAEIANNTAVSLELWVRFFVLKYFWIQICHRSHISQKTQLPHVWNSFVVYLAGVCYCRYCCHLPQSWLSSTHQSVLVYDHPDLTYTYFYHFFLLFPDLTNFSGKRLNFFRLSFFSYPSWVQRTNQFLSTTTQTRLILIFIIFWALSRPQQFLSK
jgi:hypothetical protein